MSGRLEGDKFPSRRGNPIRVRRIGEGHHAIGVADIEGIAQKRHAERLVQPFHESPARFGDAVAIPVAQQGDTIGAVAKFYQFEAAVAWREVVECVLEICAAEQDGYLGAFSSLLWLQAQCKGAREKDAHGGDGP